MPIPKNIVVIQILADSNTPIALNLTGDPAKRYVLTEDVTFRLGDVERTIPAGFEFDGPTIPRLLWWIPGLSPADIDAALASCLHDWCCDHPDLVPRAYGDALFFVMLGPKLFNTKNLPGVSRRRRAAMSAAVVAYSWITGKGWK
jgi:hypothetical protein